MKLVNEGNGLWAIELPDGSRPVQHESYQVCSNIAEGSVSGYPDECDEVRESLEQTQPGRAWLKRGNSRGCGDFGKVECPPEVRS